jgi:glucan phosphoethanolaminetransferase (alkaline phosphatase superfamily)
VSAFAGVGFATWWISAQGSDSPAGVVHRIASEARVRRYLADRRDDALVDELRALLASPDLPRKVLVVLHMRGNHFGAEIPPMFRRFASSEGGQRPAAGDAYDDGILFTDQVLWRVIQAVQSRDVQGAVFYCSDHGENLRDVDGLHGHGIGNEHDLRTAALFWYSTSLATARPDAVARGRSRASARLATASLSHAILDLAGIDAAGLDRSRSIFSESFRESPRLVHAMWSPGLLLDFDARAPAPARRHPD